MKNDFRQTFRLAALEWELSGSVAKDMTQELIHKLIAEHAQMKRSFASLVRLLTRKGSLSRDELAAVVVAAVDAEDCLLCC